MGHAVDQELFSLVQHDVRELIEMLKKIEMESPTIQVGSLSQQHPHQSEFQETFVTLQTKLKEHGEKLDVVLQQQDMQSEEIRLAKAGLREENKNILEKLVSIEKLLTGELSLRVQRVEANLAETYDKVKELEKDFTGLYSRPGNYFSVQWFTAGR